MEWRVSLREANQHLSRYVRAVEAGDAVLITRRGQPIARLVPAGDRRALTEEQVEARRRCRARLRQGDPLGGDRADRQRESGDCPRNLLGDKHVGASPDLRPYVPPLGTPLLG